MQSQALPSHRQFYTSLIDAIARNEQQTGSGALLSPDTAPPLPSSSRRLLLTLHVLFPNLVLPALDLLDRRLVARFVAPAHQPQRQPGTFRSATEIAGQNPPSHNNSDKVDEGKPTGDEIPLWVVQSAVTHRRRDAKPISKRYVVHPRAWNCSCPAFAMDAYHHPPPQAPNPHRQEETTEERHVSGTDFGGLSLDGRRMAAASWDDVPCCKHLLACFLAERWDGVLGGHVETVMATKEEMAAVVASL